jgi:glycosyltransferase involved in cell wall biosynthesis
LQFKTIETAKKKKHFPSNNVLTYVAKGRETFYGINKVLKLATKYPQLIFNVIGTDGDKLEFPENVKFYGWVGKKRAEELRNECPIFIRLTEHDGYALSVLEALSNGNYVLWNNPHSQCYFAEYDEDIEETFDQILIDLKQNNRKRIEANIDWCLQNLDETTVLQNYISKLEEIARK